MAKEANRDKNIKPKPKRRPGRPISKTELVKGPITSENIKNAFINAKIKAPSDEVLESLSVQFSIYKEFFINAQEEHKRKEQANSVLDAIKMLEETLPSLHQYHRSIQKSWSFSSSHAESIEKFIQSLCSIKQAATLPPVHESLNDWRWLIGVIHEKKLLETILGADYGFSRSGPATRFYSQIIPLVSGDQVTSEAIKTQMGLYKVQDLKGDN